MTRDGFLVVLCWAVILLIVFCQIGNNNLFTTVRKTVSSYVTEDLYVDSNNIPDESHADKRSESEQHHQNKTDRQVCMFPELDPFDESVRPYIQHPRSFSCKKIQEDFTYVNRLGQVTLNTTLIKHHERKNNKRVRCKWKTLAKNHGDKNAIIETPYQMFNETSVKTNKNIVQVVCGVTEGEVKEIYFNLHMLPGVLKRPLQPPNEHQLSVYILIIESMSRSRFERHMQSLKSFMTHELQSFTFTGFNKVADNTYVNMVPLFTGKRAVTQQYNMKDEFQKHLRGLKSYDEVDSFIWKKFRKAGYATAFVEDETQISTFEYNRKGFHSRQPFDFYYRPFFIRKEYRRKKSSKYCFGNSPAAKEQLDITHRIFEQYGKTQKLFAINFQVEIGHEKENDVEMIDDMMTQHLRGLHSAGFLNKSVLLVLGDHGPRYGKVRLTNTGYFEERLPFLSITLPPWFIKKYPEIARNLWKNKQRLVTHFDIHKTLLHVLNGDYALNNLPHESRGRSILHEISKNRTCASAGVPEFYCSCFRTKPLSKTTELARRISKLLVDHINKNILSETKPQAPIRTKKCSKLKLIKILQFDEMTSGIITTKRKTKDYKVMIKTLPGGGIFETLVKYNQTNKQYSFPNEISRLNMYGKQGKCVTRNQKFCYCQAM